MKFIIFNGRYLYTSIDFILSIRTYNTYTVVYSDRCAIFPSQCCDKYLTLFLINNIIRFFFFVGLKKHNFNVNKIMDVILKMCKVKHYITNLYRIVLLQNDVYRYIRDIYICWSCLIKKKKKYLLKIHIILRHIYCNNVGSVAISRDVFRRGARGYHHPGWQFFDLWDLWAAVLLTTT